MENLPIKKRKYRYQSAWLEKLDSEITLEILSWLPVDSVLLCAEVCKTWRTLLISNIKYFAVIQLRRQLQLLKRHGDNEKDDHDHDDRLSKRLNINGGTMGLGLLFLINESGTLRLHYDDFYNIDNVDDRMQQQSYFYTKLLTRMDRIPVIKRAYLVGSCNGLICFSVSSYTASQILHRDLIYICNPITGENAKLPRLRRKFPERYIVNGFGYHPSSNKYKVGKVVYYLHEELCIGHVQVYTLGEGSGWRNKGKIKYSLLGPPGIPMNGALHWIEHMNCWKVLRFDLADEKFLLLQPPPFVGTGESNYYKLRELGMCLCAVRGELRVDGSVDVWSLKKKKRGNCSNNKKKQDYHSWIWTKEFSIAREGFGLLKNEYNRHLFPLFLTKSGEILFQHNRENALSLYDPKTTTTKMLVTNDMGLTFVDDAIPHMNSFVSLRALGENSKRVRRSHDDHEKIMERLWNQMKE